MKFYFFFVFLLIDILRQKRFFVHAFDPQTSEELSICGPTTKVILEENGAKSSKVIDLEINENGSMCNFEIRAPASHVVHMQFIETSVEIHRNWMSHNAALIAPCTLKVFLPENDQAVWSGDLCSMDFLPPVGLLTPEIILSWDPPGHVLHTKGRQIIVTSVGKGDFCYTPGQHVCSRIGWKPAHCVSDSLLCDGPEHCPKGSTFSDEDEDLCKNQMLVQRSWEQLAVELIKKFKPSPELAGISNKWFQDQMEAEVSSTARNSIEVSKKKKGFNWNGWQDWPKVEVTTKSPIEIETYSFGSLLAQYGPWGYLMIGMLICASILMFCGVWECCFRRRKPETVSGSSQPTTVVMMYDGEVPTNEPPNYNDLDQPPSYTILFPNNKINVIREIMNPSELNENGDGVSARNLDSINELCVLTGEASQSTDHYESAPDVGDSTT